jgi:hypothetical protein
MTTKGKCDTVNSEYTVANSKYYHLSYTNLLSNFNFIKSTKFTTKTPLNANAHWTPISNWYK